MKSSETDGNYSQRIRRNIWIAAAAALLIGGVLPILVLFSAFGSLGDNPRRAEELTHVAWLLIVLELVAFGIFLYLHFRM
ncbi:hypothetical protein Bequi_13320 [Brachybacterium sp. JHP9]|uniref:Uncharacterized protein n=1 Tax=Brachybacterium equifaecis TaxID=2910770 RepID=A0ABT0R607_9MICO|nr:hypothetical protein [Brachybacterium equifaecis]MCL6424345.1 hypothetical protein [Brachybacterium equifaecis]